MTIELSDGAVRQIVSLLGIKSPEYKEISLNHTEIEALYNLSLARKNKDQGIAIRTNHGSGIGENVKVIIDGKETDITDYESW